ncbi:antitoxin [Agromyces sp. ISL-38]|uniref:ribbon-helix-helix domain-containing protein n=1 Tax=Agromyces sp. ISL-38 TaxID=2819107 RepID=UPI001BE7A19F|nr:ribbon-helix-helix domain-containing protein [Agromyces sp. ISL-38]MBT2497917.1 antitoxin [Agromyces sp. ISL-38]
MTKLSVSLPDDDLRFLDALAESFDGNRSAAVHEVIRTAREVHAAREYAVAFADWSSSDTDVEWEATTADGIDS